MPLHLKRQLGTDGCFGIWKIEEDDAFFERILHLSPEEERQLSELKARRRTEWLATRWLLHLLSAREERGPLIKDQFGKPHLSGSRYHISISHTHGYAAAIVAKSLVGIDIQVPVSKISRIAPKFMSEQEMRNVALHRSIEYLHIYWGMKECLYKAYGRREIDYKRDLLIHPFNIESQKAIAEIRKGNRRQYGAYFALCSAYILTYVIQR